MRNYSGFVPSSTPQFGKVTQVMQATFVSDTVMTCLAPKFGGRLVYNRATLDVRVTLNGDWHDAAALSHSSMVVMGPPAAAARRARARRRRRSWRRSRRR